MPQLQYMYRLQHRWTCTSTGSLQWVISLGSGALQPRMLGTFFPLLGVVGPVLAAALLRDSVIVQRHSAAFLVDLMGDERR